MPVSPHANPPSVSTRLRRVSSDELTIRRIRHGRSFGYRDAEGGKITDEATLARIRSLAIPPAYEDVRIAADPRAHLQAIGHDEAGRAQHRYHPDWEKVRERRKLKRLARLIAALPRLRARLKGDERCSTVSAHPNRSRRHTARASRAMTESAQVLHLTLSIRQAPPRPTMSGKRNLAKAMIRERWKVGRTGRPGRDRRLKVSSSGL